MENLNVKSIDDTSQESETGLHVDAAFKFDTGVYFKYIYMNNPFFYDNCYQKENISLASLHCPCNSVAPYVVWTRIWKGYCIDIACSHAQIEIAYRHIAELRYGM